MDIKSVIVTELRTNTIYISESSARDIRKTRVTPTGRMFAQFKKAYPTAKVICLSDVEFVNRFQKIPVEAYNQHHARFVLTKINPERTFLHYQEIA